MKATCLLLAIGLACATADSSRIIGGSVTTISQYPSIVSMLYSRDGGASFWQGCGGTIVNTRTIVTAAHCTADDRRPDLWRARVGSTWANSGGTVHTLTTIINHPQYNRVSFMDSDISVVRTASVITYINNAVQPGTFAGTNYNTGDNAVVWAAGWGFTSTSGPVSEQLRHVQVWTVNQQICLQRYGPGWFTITDNMLCSGWLDVGGRDQCSNDSGGPLYHNGVVVGVCSWGNGCASARYPGVNTRVSRFFTWIQANA